MESTPNGFEDFWLVYPRRVAKEAAKRAYRKALKLSTPTEILKGAKIYANERLGQDASFTKHPSTWLNGGCWGDYAPAPEAKPSAGFYASFTSRELDAWDAYKRSKGGKGSKGSMGYPRDKRGGWLFPTQWPPGYEPQKQQPGRGQGNWQGQDESESR